MKLSEADITQAIEKKMDRSTWQKWKISDLVENINEKITPKDSGLEHYIGLEHLDSGSLHISRFGETASLTGDKLKIYKGDLIFAKRNAYLKRVAIAEFDAVASAHSLVLRAKPESVLPEFLPFFLLSETFWERAIEISVGSLSPTINWRVLAKQEFLLPPRAQQAEIAELLWAIDETIQKVSNVTLKLRRVFERHEKDFFDAEDGFPLTSLGELVDIKSGDSPSKFTFRNEGEGIPFYKVKDLNFSTMYQGYAKEWVEPIPKKLVVSGSVIFPKRGAAIMTNKVRITSEDCHVDTNTMALKSRREEILSTEYLFYFLAYKKLFKIADTSQIPQINNVHINPYEVHLPPISIQKEFCDTSNKMRSQLSQNESHADQSRSLQKSLINQIL